jgi:transposase
MSERVGSTDLLHDLEALHAVIARQSSTLSEQTHALEQAQTQHAAALRHAQSQQTEREDAIAARDVTIAHLNEQIALLLARRFGSSSEAVSEAQWGLFNEAEVLAGEHETDETESSATTVGPYQRGVPKRRPLPEHLTRVEIEHPLPQDQRMCPEHGIALERFDETRFEQLEVIPATAHVLCHIRGKYRSPCCTGNLVTAPMPAQPIPKSWASPGLLAHLATGKFVDALPLYRQHRQLERIGCELSRTTLAMWMIRAGQLVQPLINLLRDTMLCERYVLMDETTMQVLKEPGKAPESKSYLWAQMSVNTASPIILFDYDPSRSAAVPTRLLEGFEGALHTDGYRGYDRATEELTLIRLYCFAHARRKFVDVLKSLGLNPKKLPATPPAAARRALKALSLIKALYAIERRIKDQPPDERYRIRQRDSLPVLDKLHTWMKATLPKVLPGGAMGGALRYLDHHWDGLVRYCDDGRYRIDTNPIENAFRPFCVGRRNWMFSDTVAGAKSSANLYSLVETARANGLDPYGYLRKVFTDLPNATTVEDIEALLPGVIDPDSVNPHHARR